jgi:pimeloyl-ACP methyl ester carboxylesterase
MFDANGVLLPGTHQLTEAQFLKEFCEASEERKPFFKPCLDIFDWTKEAGATVVIFGGSFVSRKPDPKDLDALIVFPKKEQIPRSSERLDIEGFRLDIQMASEDEPEIVGAFLRLFSEDLAGAKKGVIAVAIGSTTVWSAQEFKTSDDKFEIVKRAYINRRFVVRNESKGVLVTVHGIKSHAEWNALLTLRASNAGWTVAPFLYGYQTATLLADEKARKKIVEDFRHWLARIHQEHRNLGVAIVAHSFGTYIVGRYLKEAGDLPVPDINSLILAGSILDTQWDWNAYVPSYAGGKINLAIGSVLNTISEDDEWVKLLPDGGLPLARDPLYGQSGLKGFAKASPILMERRSRLLGHNNVVCDDVILGMWLPFLEANIGAHRRLFEHALIAYYTTKDAILAKRKQ